MLDQANVPATAVVGLQWGDEGKGKLVDCLAGAHDAVVRYNGGANAGHSVVVGETRYALHLVPSGILHPGVRAVIGNGVVVDPGRLGEELDGLIERGVDVSGLALSSRAHVVMPYHKAEDELREALLTRRVGGDASGARAVVGSIGTTKRGIGPAYAEKVTRSSAVRVGDLLRPELLREKVELACAVKNAFFTALGVEGFEPFDAGAIAEEAAAHGERLRHTVTDTTELLLDLLDDGRRVLFEGANATMLDVDHGTFPFVTSSNASALGIGPGTGVPPQRVTRIIGVVKAYSTRVGGGPMPTELDDAVAEGIRERGREFGTTTGRPRRVGWLDLVAVRYAARVCGATELNLTLLDVLSGVETLRLCTGYRVEGAVSGRFVPDAFDLDRVEPVLEDLSGFGEDISGCRAWGELPAAARAYVERVEAYVGVPVASIGVGPDRSQIIERGR
ncbi:MAG: adenylosuccinate synthase [Planctomycetota bacterium]